MRYLTILILSLLVSSVAVSKDYTCKVRNGAGVAKFDEVCVLLLAELTARGTAPAVWNDNRCASRLLRRAAKAVFMSNEDNLARQALSERVSDKALEVDADFGE